MNIVKELINSKHERKKRDLELKKLSAEADLTEQQALSVALANLEKARELRLSTADDCVAPLADAAKQVEIEPSQAK